MSQARPTDAEATTYAENYVLYGDRTRAWKLTFPESEAKDDKIHVSASRFNSRVKVQLRIAELREQAKNYVNEEFNWSFEEKKKQLAEIVGQGRDEGSLSASVSAIKEMNAMDGDHAAEKREVTRKDNNHINKIEIMVVGANDTN